MLVRVYISYEFPDSISAVNIEINTLFTNANFSSLLLKFNNSIITHIEGIQMGNEHYKYFNLLVYNIARVCMFFVMVAWRKRLH